MISIGMSSGAGLCRGNGPAVGLCLGYQRSSEEAGAAGAE